MENSLHLSLIHISMTAEWQITGKSTPSRNDVHAYMTYGTCLLYTSTIPKRCVGIRPPYSEKRREQQRQEAKRVEMRERNGNAKLYLTEALKEATIYVNGDVLHLSLIHI